MRYVARKKREINNLFAARNFRATREGRKPKRETPDVSLKCQNKFSGTNKLLYIYASYLSRFYDLYKIHNTFNDLYNH